MIKVKVLSIDPLDNSNHICEILESTPAAEAFGLYEGNTTKIDLNVSGTRDNDCDPIGKEVKIQRLHGYVWIANGVTVQDE